MEKKDISESATGYLAVFVFIVIYILLVRAALKSESQEASPLHAWNDTPTIGMTGEYIGKEPNISPGDMATPPQTNPMTTPIPGGMPAKSPKHCTTPTGFLMLAVQAYDQNLRQGMINMNGVDVDMGKEGAFYDRWGDGCCDAYCRIVGKSQYWSCIGPESRTSQYLQSRPRGRKCTKYGNERNKLL